MLPRPAQWEGIAGPRPAAKRPCCLAPRSGKVSPARDRPRSGHAASPRAVGRYRRPEAGREAAMLPRPTQWGEADARSAAGEGQLSRPASETCHGQVTVETHTAIGRHDDEVACCREENLTRPRQRRGGGRDMPSCRQDAGAVPVTRKSLAAFPYRVHQRLHRVPKCPCTPLLSTPSPPTT
jgi:hypothetical protein